jgi:hypothetical protein
MSELPKSQQSPKAAEPSAEQSRMARLMEVLFESALPGTLVEEIKHVIPAELSEDTIEIFARFYEHCRQETQGHENAIIAFSHALTSSRIGRRLGARWKAEGGQQDDLAKLTAMAGYRYGVLQGDPWYSGNTGNDSRSPKPADLEYFWTAGGHDLTELAGFLRKIDKESMDWLPT